MEVYALMKGVKKRKGIGAKILALSNDPTDISEARDKYRKRHPNALVSTVRIKTFPKSKPRKLGTRKFPAPEKLLYR